MPAIKIPISPPWGYGYFDRRHGLRSGSFNAKRPQRMRKQKKEYPPPNCNPCHRIHQSLASYRFLPTPCLRSKLPAFPIRGNAGILIAGNTSPLSQRRKTMSDDKTKPSVDTIHRVQGDVPLPSRRLQATPGRENTFTTPPVRSPQSHHQEYAKPTEPLRHRNDSAHTSPPLTTIHR